MKLCSFSVNGVSSFGAVTPDGNGVIDVGRRMSAAGDLGTVLRQGRLAECVEIAAAADADFQLVDVTYEMPIAHPGKILCIGVNYGGRNAEYLSLIHI